MVVSKLAAAPSVERILSSYRRFASPAIAFEPLTVTKVVAVLPVKAAPPLASSQAGAVPAPVEVNTCPSVP